MVYTQAFQRTMPTSTSYSTSAPSVRAFRLPHQRKAHQQQVCSSYRQNCGPRNAYGPRWGPIFNQMAGGPSAAQLEDMIKEFARAFGNSPYNYGNNGNNGSQGPASPSGFLPIDLEEQETLYLLTADVPGLQKADLKISVNQTDKTLKIAGERQRSSWGSSEGDSQSRYKRQYERTMGKFSRTLAGLANDADLSAVSARVDKGVLTISVQKKDLSKEEDEIRVDID